CARPDGYFSFAYW
nr:immunoglobulin heavy chain junction region [Mus musculus]